MSYTERACAIDLSLQSLLQRLVIKYAILETHSIKETGADIWRQRFHSVYEDIRLRPSTPYKTHKQRFQIYPNLCVYGERFHRLRVDGRPKRIKKSAFTSVCVYNNRDLKHQDGRWRRGRHIRVKAEARPASRFTRLNMLSNTATAT